MSDEEKRILGWFLSALDAVLEFTCDGPMPGEAPVCSGEFEVWWEKVYGRN